MDIVSERIRELISELGLSNKDFADAIEVSPAIISHVLSGRNKASLHLIQQITNVYTNVNLDYLLNGKGNLFAETEKRQEYPDAKAPSSPFQDGVRRVAPPSSTPLAHKSPVEPKADAGTDHREEESTNVYTNVNRAVKASGKQIERVIIFYSDKSMEEYQP